MELRQMQHAQIVIYVHQVNILMVDPLVRNVLQASIQQSVDQRLVQSVGVEEQVLLIEHLVLHVLLVHIPRKTEDVHHVQMAHTLIAVHARAVLVALERK